MVGLGVGNFTGTPLVVGGPIENEHRFRTTTGSVDLYVAETN